MAFKQDFAFVKGNYNQHGSQKFKHSLSIKTTIRFCIIAYAWFLPKLLQKSILKLFFLSSKISTKSKKIERENSFMRKSTNLNWLYKFVLIL